MTHQTKRSLALQIHETMVDRILLFIQCKDGKLELNTIKG